VRILGIDCGSRRTGYGVIESDGAEHKIVAAGAIEPASGGPFEKRLLEIAERFRGQAGGDLDRAGRSPGGCCFSGTPVARVVSREPDANHSPARDDDGVNTLYRQIYSDLLRGMLADPLCIERSSHLIIVIKNWERIADQATNIAEEVLFILEGRNVKHSYLQEAPNP